MDNLAVLILTVLALLIITIFVGSIYAFFYAIINFVFSSGDPEKIKKAWNSIRYMILGLVMTLAILFIGPILLKKANVPGYQYYTASNIFAQISLITGGLMDFTKDAANEYQSGGNLITTPPRSTTNTGTIQPSDDYDYDDLEL